MDKELLENIRGIYKINFPNGKYYIGMSNQIKTRIKEHINKDYKEHPELPISRAINKYGIQDVEILEELPKDFFDRKYLSDREKYWIKFYNSNNKKYGYNISSGGDGAGFGWENSSASLTKEQVFLLYDLLIKSNKTYKQIIEEDFNNKLTVPVIERINSGQTYFNPELDYPLRKKIIRETGFNNKNSFFYQKKDLFYQLVKDLQENEELKFQDLYKKYNITPSTLNAINNGKIIYDDRLTYPIRKNSKGKGHKKIFSQETLNNIKKDLQGETLSFIKIAEKYNTSSDMISKINKGVKQKQENWEYPIRKNYLTPGPKKS